MEMLWTHYAKTQLRSAQAFEEEHSELSELTRAQEVHAWEDWAYVHYLEPIESQVLEHHVI